MRHVKRFLLTAVVAAVLLTTANTAQAAEPQESSFWLRSLVDFFSFCFGF